MSGKVVIIAEHKNGSLKGAAKELLGAAAGRETHAVILGSTAKAAADELAQLGCQAHWVKDEKFNHYHSEAYAAACAKVIGDLKPEYVLANATSLGKDLLPKLAARFDSTIAADCTELSLSEEKIRKPFFAGKATASVKFENSPMKFVSLRPNSLPQGKVGDAAGAVSDLSVDFDFAGSAIQFVGQTDAKSDRPDLTEANVIVSGGRSLKSRENFKIIFDLADALGGATGASRAAVDEGMADHDMQVGQTGKTVNPSVYIACGISGAIQHLAGMRTSKVIVAINKDENAPIFSKANYGIVGDLFEVVPALTQEAKSFLA